MDIGANWGTHSPLFLAHGIPAFSFEPIEECHREFNRMCLVNDVTPTIEHVALGAINDIVEIAYPAPETWLGSTRTDVIEQHGNASQMKRVTVPQRKLDDDASQIAGRRTLIKIDVEGNELAVLQGSSKILQTIKPTIIFESFRDDARLPIYDFPENRCYSVHDLPYSPGDSTRPLSRVEFRDKRATNFVALPFESQSSA